jgi:hypothetical protein
MRADTIVLTLVGVGIIVTGIFLILQIRQQAMKPKEEVVRREVDVEVDPVAGSWGWGWAGGWLPAWGYQPYYSRMPIRPLLY